MEWDDLRVFLAVARSGAVRRAARELAVDHSTVSRRLAALEQRLGVRLLERRASSYETTAAGEELLVAALRVEEELLGVTQRVQARDTRLRGDVRVSAPGSLAQGLLMPDFAVFAERYPDIDLEVVVSYEIANLSRREADVAIRITNSAPEHLEAEHIVGYAMARYATPEYLALISLSQRPADARWIGWDLGAPYPKSLKNGPYPDIPVRSRFPDVLLQFEAARLGMGIAALPCFLGDEAEELVRVPPMAAEIVAGVWLLRHPDARATARVRAFVDFMAAALRRRRALMEGRARRRGRTAKRGKR